MLQHRTRLEKLKTIIEHLDKQFTKPHEMLYLKRALAAGFVKLASRDTNNNSDCETEQAAEALDVIIAELEEYF